MTIYPDSSFLFSRYVSDRHSQEADFWMLRQPQVMVTPFHEAELANAIFQWVFRGHITDGEAQLANANFEQDCESGVWVPAKLPDLAFLRCVDLGRRLGAKIGTRTLDSLHVAVALELGAGQFWTFDERQKKLAEAAGLATD